MNAIWNQHWLFIILFLAFGLFTVLVNYFTVRRFGQYPPARHLPRLSVLVPARNEENNIETCIASLLAQDYPDFEVIVLNDHSTDGTPQALARLLEAHLSRSGLEGRLRVLEGRPLPEGWLGKHWACHQLAEAAAGDFLLFTDADTYHAPHTLRDSVSALLAENADLVTAFPREEVVTWGERLLVPFIGFGIFTFLPIRLIQRLRWSALSITIGQFMLFRRSAYEKIGGFEAVRDEVLDDIRLGQRLINMGFEWRLMNGTHHISCHMYHGFWHAVEGFGKSLFAIFDYRILPFLLAFMVVGMAFLEPPLALVARGLDWPQPPFPTLYAQAAVIFSLLLWSIAFRRFRFPAYLVFFYPIILTLFLMVAMRSLVQAVTGTASWKGRTLDRVAMRWL